MIIDHILTALLIPVYLVKSLCCLTVIFFVILVAIAIWQRIFKRACECTANLNGKIALVTGCNAGIGFETAKLLAKRGAKVVIASHNVEKSKAAAADIKEATGNPNVEVKPLDFTRFASVKQFAEDFEKSYERLDILINSPGLNMLCQVFTGDGIEKVMQVNHIGPAYLTKLLLNKVEASKPSRVIFSSSVYYKLHRLDPDDIVGKAPNDPLTLYSNSKFCNILTARALAKQVPEGVTVNAVHPGCTASEILESIECAKIKKILLFALRYFFKTAEECAQSLVHVAGAPSLASMTGQYFAGCQVAKPWRRVTDELAERVWDDTVKIAEEKASYEKRSD